MNLFDKALVLTRKDFSIENGKVSIKNKNFKDGCLLIYAPWCPHCVNKNDTINRLSEYVKKNYSDYMIAVANGDDPEMRDILKELKQSGFPTFYHLRCQNSDKTKLDILEFGEKGFNMLNAFSE